MPLNEEQIPQVVEKLESGGKPKEALERVGMRPRQERYQAALGPLSTSPSRRFITTAGAFTWGLAGTA